MAKSTIGQLNSHIRLKLIAYMAFRNLWFKRFRSFLTILGVIIGIGSIFLLFSFGLGLQHLVQAQVIGSSSINTIDVTPANSKIISLNQASTEQFKSIQNVQNATGVYAYASKLKLKAGTSDVVAFGVDSLYLDLSNLSLKAGLMPDLSKTDEMLINSSMLEAIGLDNAEESLGQQAELSLTLPDGQQISRNLKIVGVIDAASGSEIFASKSIFDHVTSTSYSQVKLVVNNRDNVNSVRRAVESQGFQTSSPLDTLQQIDQVFKFFNFILIGFGSIGMIIAVLGMLNTLTVSLLERTQEIALMIALGGRPEDMRRLFIAEALSLSVAGGVIGMLLATLLGNGVDMVLNELAFSRGVRQGFTVFATPPVLLLITSAFMVFVGVAVALVPARRAASTNPIDALRHE